MWDLAGAPTRSEAALGAGECVCACVCVCVCGGGGAASYNRPEGKERWLYVMASCYIQRHWRLNKEKAKMTVIVNLKAGNRGK